MTAPAPAARLIAADLQAKLARERLDATVAKLQARLAPRKLAHQAKQEASDRGLVAMETVADTGYRHRVPIAGAIAGLVVFLIGRPIVRRVRRRRRARHTNKS